MKRWLRRQVIEVRLRVRTWRKLFVDDLPGDH